MTNFLVACGVLLRGDAAELLNNIPYLLFDPPWSERTMRNTVFVEENCEQHFVLLQTWREGEHIAKAEHGESAAPGNTYTHICYGQ
jgi:hypothetical protein